MSSPSTTDAPKPTERSVTIQVNRNKDVVVPEHTTGLEIKEKAGVPTDYDLFRVHGDTEDKIEDDEAIKVHEHERFVASPSLDPS